MEAPRPLVSAQKDANNKNKPPEDTKRRGRTILGDKGAHIIGGQDTRLLKRESPQNRQGAGHRFRPEGEGIGLSQWQHKNGTKKGSPTGVNRDAHDVEGGERESSEQGKRWQKRARGVGIQGMRETLGIRSRVARKRAQGQVVEAVWSRRLYRRAGDPRKE